MKVDIYSIRDLENLTGIKAHTIRMWEQRYEIVSPKRTDSNIRYYDAEDLKRMLNVALLNNHGLKISKIAKMSQEQLCMQVNQTLEQASDYQSQINALTVAMIEFNEEQFEKIIVTNILQIGFEQTMVHIIFPFLMRIGVLWTTDAINPAQEHFVTNLIRQKIIVAIDGQVTPKNGKAENYMLYLPEDELHEISLLFACYLIKSRGNKVVYLGQNLPFTALKDAYKIYKPDYFFTVLTTNPPLEEVQDYVDTVAKDFPHIKIFVTGSQVVGQDIQGTDNLWILNKIQDFIDYLER
ncbi:MAG: MerR family transcriptional regulator [Bernardetiaceae bacterium]|nr:MerR family transcriptional regulator [Bernardetiaceae bacterium]